MYHVGLQSIKRSWKGAFGVAGKPVVSLTHEITADDDDEEQPITREEHALRESGVGVHLKLRSDKIPGQRRILRRMNDNERIQIFKENLKTRKDWVNAQRENGTNIQIIDARNLQYAIYDTWNVQPTDTDEFWSKLMQVGMTAEEIQDSIKNWATTWKGAGIPHTTDPVYE